MADAGDSGEWTTVQRKEVAPKRGGGSHKSSHPQRAANGGPSRPSGKRAPIKSAGDAAAAPPAGEPEAPEAAAEPTTAAPVTAVAAPEPAASSAAAAVEQPAEPVKAVPTARKWAAVLKESPAARAAPPAAAPTRVEAPPAPKPAPAPAPAAPVPVVEATILPAAAPTPAPAAAVPISASTPAAPVATVSATAAATVSSPSRAASKASAFNYRKALVAPAPRPAPAPVATAPALEAPASDLAVSGTVLTPAVAPHDAIAALEASTPSINLGINLGMSNVPEPDAVLGSVNMALDDPASSAAGAPSDAPLLPVLSADASNGWLRNLGVESGVPDLSGGLLSFGGSSAGSPPSSASAAAMRKKMLSADAREFVPGRGFV